MPDDTTNVTSMHDFRIERRRLSESIAQLEGDFEQPAAEPGAGVDVRAPLPPTTGGGSNGGMSDDWKASVDAQLTQLHGDVRALLAAIVAGFLLLAGGGWLVYDKNADKFERVEQSITELKVEQAKTNGKLDQLLERRESEVRR